MKSLSVDRAFDVVSVPLPTPYGEMLVQAFERPSGLVYLAVSRGDIRGDDVLARVHSECLTGDVLGSLRCDCGVQLREALRGIAAEGRGVLVYATGHEGRGIGLVNKLRAYLEQDAGADTLDANLNLGLEVDGRNYADAAEVLLALGVRSVRLLTNNPGKVTALRAAGIDVRAMEPLAVASHTRNVEYLRTKEARLGHVAPSGRRMEPASLPPPDPTEVLGRVVPRADRPYVVLKYAQTLDGRIATASGDSRWISGEGERTLSHALRAACDGVLVGVGTVLRDDPQLTVRMVPGASPVRVVLDSTLRTPADAKVLQPDAGTLLLTTEDAPPDRVEALRRRGVGVRLLPAGPGGVDLRAALAAVAETGVRALLVEGGSRVLTSLLGCRLVDRLVVSVSPTIIGAGTEAIGALGTERVCDGLALANRSVHMVGQDLLLAWDVVA